MTIPKDQVQVEKVVSRLHELGWYAWANDIAAGRANQSDLADALGGVLAEKRDWLRRHGFVPNSEGEARHERMRTWCDNATALIIYMQDTQEVPHA